MSELLLDAAGRPRSPATLPGYHAGRPPRNKGIATPRTRRRSRRSSAVMRHAGNGLHGRRLRGLIVVLWRAGLRIHEALALNEGDLDRRRGSLLVRRGKGGRRREVGMDDWAWEQLAAVAGRPSRAARRPAVLHRQRRHARARMVKHRRPRRAAPRRPQAGVRRRFAPHQLRHAHAVEMAREGVPLIVIQRQLGHTSLGITSIYLQGIDSAEIIDAVHARRAPMIPVDASLRQHRPDRPQRGGLSRLQA